MKQTYIVRKGDTLSQIVWKQYHSFAYMDRIQRINQIEDTDRIYVGQCILLPDA
ncbi:MAG: LysM peptidoglycan-binding domain-containing protein [Lachnospiraceae bacterium]|nr:LysM peptidoglycan-binding domain-containing protein [Lachnospiraceae bacterium]